MLKDLLARNWVLVIGLASAASIANGQPVAAIDAGANQANHKALFPHEFEHWKTSSAQRIEGIEKANGLRIQLLADRDGDLPYGDQICQVVEQFQLAAANVKDLGVRIDKFNMPASRFRRQLLGEESMDIAAFNAFKGTWFGTWDQIEVNHNWHAAELYQPPQSWAKDQPIVCASQYAWIGNGFGWNYLVGSADDPKQHFVIGMVYYLDSANLRSVTGEKAHVGFVDSPTRLVWITDSNVYLEESFTGTENPDQYAITAIEHRLFSDKPSVSSQAIQAIYTRDPNNRPAFRQFTWRPTQ